MKSGGEGERRRWRKKMKRLGETRNDYREKKTKTGEQGRSGEEEKKRRSEVMPR